MIQLETPGRRPLCGAPQVERLHTLLRPHLLRRMKADVLRQLPPKREQIVAVELSAAQKQARLAGRAARAWLGGQQRLAGRAATPALLPQKSWAS